MGCVSGVGGEEDDNQQPGLGRQEEQDMERSEAMKEALKIVTAQASVRAMTSEEVTMLVASLTSSIMNLGEDIPSEQPSLGQGIIDPKTALKENSITCLECGKRFKILTKKHLAQHGLTPDEYRAKYGFKKTQALACKSLARERRKTMKKSKLWERRKKPETSVQQ